MILDLDFKSLSDVCFYFLLPNLQYQYPVNPLNLDILMQTNHL
jgi:hypothetical protein